MQGDVHRRAGERVAGLQARLGTSYVGECFRRTVGLKPIDRALAIASRGFVALLPLAIVSTSLSPAARNGGFAQGVIDRFGLDGQGAEDVRRLFATPSEVRGGLSVLGVLVLAYSVLGFARILTRVYEQAWQLPPSGLHGLARGLVWVAAAAAYVGFLAPLRGAATHATGRLVSDIVVLATYTACWLVTPQLLLAGRVPFRRLLPTAALTAAGMALAGVVAGVYMPGAMTTSAERYGLVGVAFTIVSWLTGIGAVLVVAAGIGAVTAERYVPPRAAPPVRAAGTRQP